mgnify:CR=1 FL=1
MLRAIEELGPQADIPEEDLAAYKALSQSLYDAKTERLEHGGCELEIFSAGEKWDGSPVRYGEGQYPWSPFPASVMSPVWPSEYIGLSDAGTKEFEIMKGGTVTATGGEEGAGIGGGYWGVPVTRRLQKWLHGLVWYRICPKYYTGLRLPIRFSRMD